MNVNETKSSNMKPKWMQTIKNKKDDKTKWNKMKKGGKGKQSETTCNKMKQHEVNWTKNRTNEIKIKQN